MIVYAVRIPYEGIFSIHATLEGAKASSGYYNGEYGEYVVAYNLDTGEEVEVS